MDTNAERETIMEVVGKVERAIRTGNPALIAEQVTDQAVFMLPDTGTVVGRSAISQFYIDLFATKSIRLLDSSEEIVREVIVDGEIAVLRGNLRAVAEPCDGTPPVNFEHRFVNVYRRQPDGSWKLHWDIGVPTP